MRALCWVVILSLSAPAVAATSAVERRYTKAYHDCSNSGDAARGVTPAMRECIREENLRQDAQLNRTYVSVMKRQSPAGKSKLRTTQRAWIKSRDATCEAVANEAEGGSIAPILQMTCLAEETIKRTVWLERYR